MGNGENRVVRFWIEEMCFFPRLRDGWEEHLEKTPSVNGSSERSMFIDFFFYPWHHGQLVVVTNKVALSTSYNICIGALWDRQDSINNVLMVLNPLNLPTPLHPLRIAAYARV